MDQIQKFIVNLSSIIVFMTAIEIIAPENAMKKYVKFVLGLILIAFMINPIVYFASNGENIITGKIKEFQDNVQKETAYTSNKTSDNKILESNFKEKFEDNLCILLENKFKNCDFTCLLSGDITNVEKIEVFVNKKEDSNKSYKGSSINNNEVEKVKEIDNINFGNEEGKNINNSLSAVTNNSDEFLNDVQEYIKENVQIDEDKIVVKYK